MKFQELTDREWEFVKPLLPPKAPTGRLFWRLALLKGIMEKIEKLAGRGGVGKDSPVFEG